MNAFAAIHAELAPVLAYVEHMKKEHGQDRVAVTIPVGTAAHRFGYRFTTALRGEDLDYYLDHGASLAVEGDIS